MIFWKQGDLFRDFAGFFCEICRYKLEEYHDNVGFVKPEVRSKKDRAQAGVELLTSPHDTCIDDRLNGRCMRGTSIDLGVGKTIFLRLSAIG